MSIVTYNNRSIANISAIPGAAKSLTHIKTITASGQSDVTFVNGTSDVVLDSTYPIYIFKLINVHGAANDEKFYVNFRDGGSSYDANKTATNIRAFHFESDSADGFAYQDSLDIGDAHQRQEATRRIVAKSSTIGAMAYKYSIGQSFVSPKNNLSFSENFLHMCFSNTAEEYKISPILSKAMDTIFILHADHEQNASTSTVRLAGSSGANPFACIAAGVSSLWGPAHGGANQAALEMLEEIGSTKNINKYIKKAKNKKDPFKLMGFGHRVYKNYDPRAKILKGICQKVLKHVGIKNDPILKLAMDLEKIALKDKYFVEKKLYPNVDFYSGIILRAIGFPPEMFTVIFAISRTAGWTAQWTEMIEDPIQKIGRPRQLYTGSKSLKYGKIRSKKNTR